MAIRDFKLPKTPEEFDDPKFRAELVRLENMLNGLSVLKVHIEDSAGTVSGTGIIRFANDSAVISVELA